MSSAADSSVTKFHLEKYGKYYKPEILVPDYHLRLVEEIESVAQVANIPSRYIYKTRIADWCDETDENWVKRLKFWSEEGIAGLYYTGKIQHVEDRMMVMAGACIRNFIDARVYTVQSLIVKLKEETMPDPTVVFVPNFFLMPGSGGKLPEWQIALLMGWLMRRYTKNLQTCLYVESMPKLGDLYGNLFKEHLELHFICLG